MKGLIKYSAFLMVLFLVASCNNDDADFMVQLNEPFTAVIDEKYTCITDDGDEIIIEIKDLNDERAFGGLCSQVSFGGTGEIEIETKIKYNKDKYSKTFLMWGCEGIFPLEIDNPNLPNFELEDITIKVITVSPNSYTIDEPLKDLDDYEVRFVILK